MARPTIIAGNWKLNPPRTRGAQLYRDIVTGVGQRCAIGDRRRVVVCPPAPYLGLFAALARGERSASGSSADVSPVDLSRGGGPAVCLGAQDMSVETWGAFTGDLGAPLLREFGVTYVIVGHSERRQLRGETDVEVGRKASAALAHGLIPIVCVGETAAERDASETFEVIGRQLAVALDDAARTGGLDAAPGRQPGIAPLVIAYEPVWAIGTGRNASPQQAAEVHRYLRHRWEDFIRGRARQQGQGMAPVGAGEDARNEPVTVVPISIIYGGSVKPENAEALLAEPDIDGALVGGASLDSSSFLAILDAAGAEPKR